jgi:hypothetical protein
VQALAALDRIEGKAEGVSSSDIDYLRALVYLNIGRFRAAAEILHELPLIHRPRGYTQYNLGMAQLQSGNEERGLYTLESLGEINTSDTDLLALKDLANLKLGYRYLRQGSLEQARASFNRVRLDGPFTNQALLGSGWTSFTMGKFERAIVAWSMLHEQKAIDETVIEAKMALPYAYSKLGAYGKAANLYAHAVELFETEITRLDAAIEAVRRGDLSKAMINNPAMQGDEWFISLSRNSEQTGFFLPLLLTSHEFREQAEKLHQLVELNKRIEQGLITVAASKEFAGLKRQHFDSALPAAEKELSAIYPAMNNILPAASRQTDTANKSVKPIAEVALLAQAHDNYLKARKAIADYNRLLPEYNRELAELDKDLKRVDKKLDQAIDDTGQQVEAVALAMLDQKRNQLQSYHHNALFALAESYDFATGKRQ